MQYKRLLTAERRENERKIKKFFATDDTAARMCVGQEQAKNLKARGQM